MTSQRKCAYILASILALLILFGAKSVITGRAYLKTSTGWTASCLQFCWIRPFISCLSSVIRSTTGSVAEEGEDDREFDYIKGSPKGPEKWGELKPEWAACKHGKMQSPIDLSNARVKFISKPEIRIYKPSNATLKNSGYDISVNWNGDAGSIFINGTEYRLQQVHWHTPSEHTINGKRYDMELHMVHESPDLNVQNRIAVIGVMYKIGRPNEFLSKLKKSISSLIGKKGEERNLGIIDPNDIQAESQCYYRYMGSLTTPPCDEGVIWSVNTKVKNVASDQIKLLKKAVLYYAKENARPLQPRNNRDIYLYFSKYFTSY